MVSQGLAGDIKLNSLRFTVSNNGGGGQVDGRPTLVLSAKVTHVIVVTGDAECFPASSFFFFFKCSKIQRESNLLLEVYVETCVANEKMLFHRVIVNSLQYSVTKVLFLIKKKNKMY